MNHADTPPAILWRDGTLPISPAHDDPYYSALDGLAESRHVFLAGTALPERMAGAERFALAELGFGTGLNLLAAWRLWRGTARPGAVLDYTAFEIAPLSAGQMARALGRWPELAPLAGALIAAWPPPPDGRIALDGLRLELVRGDARQTVPRWPGAADAWFLDGFAPARNPEMWEPELLAAVFARTLPGGRAATYAAAGAVRRGLAAAGFEVTRAKGFGPKREMLAARRPDAGAVAIAERG
jgi:tRNA U34 5-methylaminomethyl-2-thiouridine-forming methyltransferase MnmC